MSFRTLAPDSDEYVLGRRVWTYVLPETPAGIYYLGGSQTQVIWDRDYSATGGFLPAWAGSSEMADIGDGYYRLVLSPVASAVPTDWDGTIGWLPATGGGAGGGIGGPDESVDNSVPRWNGTTGSELQDSLVVIDDLGNIATPGTVDGVDVSTLATDVAGKVAGPASSTPSAIMLFGDGTGKLAKNSNVTINAGGDITTPGLVDGVDVSGLASTVAAKAPLSTPYLTLSADATLPNERVLTQGAGIALDDAGAGGALAIRQSKPFVAHSPGDTLVLTDAFKMVGAASASPFSIFVPNNSSVAFPVGTEIYLVQEGVGTMTAVPDSGVIIYPPAGRSASLVGQYSMARLFKRTTNTWGIDGDLQESTPFVTIGTVARYPNERALTQGTGITITDGGPGGAVTISATGGAAAPLAASYLTLSADGTLTNERVLTQGPGIAFADGGAGNALKVSYSAEPASPSNGNYTLTAADAGKLLISSNNTNVNWTIPAGVLPLGTVTYVWQSAAGQITLVGSGGMVLQGTPSLKTRAQHSLVAICPAFSTSANVSGDLEGSVLGAYSLNNQTGTTYTFVLADAGKIVTGNNAAAQTFTIPANASVAYPIGTRIDLAQLGAGQITVAITTDTLLNSGYANKTRAQNSIVSLTKIAATTWLMSGDMGF